MNEQELTKKSALIEKVIAEHGLKKEQGLLSAKTL